MGARGPPSTSRQALISTEAQNELAVVKCRCEAGRVYPTDLSRVPLMTVGILPLGVQKALELTIYKQAEEPPEGAL